MRLVIIHRDGGSWTATHNGRIMSAASEPHWRLSADLLASLGGIWKGWRVVTVAAAREDYGCKVPSC
jgi:hypothetical protein